MDRLSYIQVGPINVLTPFITGNIVRVLHFLISITFFFIPNLILASPVLESLFQLSCSRCPVLESCSQAYCSRCPVLEFLFHMPHPSFPVPSCSVLELPFQIPCSRYPVPEVQLGSSAKNVGRQHNRGVLPLFFFSLHPKIPEFLEQAILGTAKYTVSPDTLIALGY